jgi:prepilin peptidase CpaA
MAEGGMAHTTVMITSIGVLAVIAYGDVRTRRIPNTLTATIAMLGLARLILVYNPIAAAQTLAAAAAIFAASFLLFCRGVFGGGDAKLVAAMVLLIGSNNVFGFLFLMSLCGGALAVAALLFDHIDLQCSRRSRLARVPSSDLVSEPATAVPRLTVPYGVAIAAAGVILILKTSFGN